MSRRRSWRVLGVVGLSLSLAGLTGCQTWVGGMTLPSGHYLQHRPQYFPPSPDFPLNRELASMEAQQGEAGTPGAVPPPAPVVPGPVGP
jgi:hypothetical protein